ncbi:hypothetical protein SAY87_014472 [Trapa incisa]|uniref:Uncharacterized protein n=1 Tax=Trapa incisa TaxID=236973 RepID=A0AAN7GNP7_9MYRT|nr:hypothetical protein SAY87_014472 [Trapa incisa]
MELEMEMVSDLEKTCTVGHIPKASNDPTHQHGRSSNKRRNSNSSSKPARRDDLLNLREDFLEIDFSRFRSVSCKNIPSRPSGIDGKVELKRASVYQSSREMRRTKNAGTYERRKIEMKNAGVIEERRKIEIPRGSSTASCLSIVDSLCTCDEGSPSKRSFTGGSLASSEVGRDPPLEEIAEMSHGDLKENVQFRCEEITGRVNDGNGIRENETVRTFPKSLSSKLQLPHSPSSLESGRTSSKARFSHIRRLLDPLMKSKSHRNPSVYAQEHQERRTIEKVDTVGARTSPSHIPKCCEPETGTPEINHATSAIANSPVHLHGILKVGMGDEQGDPYYQFFVKNSEDAFLAKALKEKNDSGGALNCVYTFHSLNSQKRSVGLGPESLEEDSTVVGQMQVSCHSHLQLEINGELDNSLVMESVLYDISQARKSKAQERSNSSTGTTTSQSSTDSGRSIHWRVSDNNSYNEIAAIYVKAPRQKTERFLQNDFQEKVRVVIPSGSHGLPEKRENSGPSSLLERWRSGGGCDCGGWDMGCPLTVLGCTSTQQGQKSPERMNRLPLELYVEGSKDLTPALAISFMEEGHYLVDFHARISSLQAFSVCAAMLYGASFSISSAQNFQERLQNNSLKALMEEEVLHFMIDAVDEDKEVLKKIEDIPACYVLNPPFSPIARV